MPAPDCRRAARRGGLRRLAAGALVLVAASAGADVDLAEYDPRAAPKDRQSQQSDARQIAIEQAAERQREAEQRQHEARLAAERRRLDEARPWPVRLTELRCTFCHAASNYAQNGHTAVGWWVVAIRMKQVNRAPVSWHELGVIVPHLAELYPARARDAMLEWGALAATLGAGAVAVLAGRRWGGRRRTRQGGSPSFSRSLP